MEINTAYSQEIFNNSFSFEEPRDINDVYGPAADENNAAAEQTQTQHQPRKRGKARTYIDWKQFDNLPAYHEFWGREKKNWTKNTDNNTGTTYLNCKYSRKTGYNCLMALKIQFSSIDLGVCIQMTEGEHDHQTKRETMPPTDDVKKQMRLLIAQKMTAAQIHNFLRRKNVHPLPKLLQVQNFVKRENMKRKNKVLKLRAIKHENADEQDDEEEGATPAIEEKHVYEPIEQNIPHQQQDEEVNLTSFQSLVSWAMDTEESTSAINQDNELQILKWQMANLEAKNQTLHAKLEMLSTQNEQQQKQMEQLDAKNRKLVEEHQKEMAELKAKNEEESRAFGKKLKEMEEKAKIEKNKLEQTMQHRMDGFRNEMMALLKESSHSNRNWT